MKYFKDIKVFIILKKMEISDDPLILTTKDRSDDLTYSFRKTNGYMVLEYYENKSKQISIAKKYLSESFLGNHSVGTIGIIVSNQIENSLNVKSIISDDVFNLYYNKSFDLLNTLINNNDTGNTGIEIQNIREVLSIIVSLNRNNKIDSV